MPTADEILAAYDARREIDGVGGPLGYLGYRPAANPWQQYDLAQLPDVGAPLIPGGAQVSPGWKPLTNVVEGLSRDIPRGVSWFLEQARKPEAEAQQDVRNVAYSLASLPARTFEASERMRSGDVYNPAPAVEAVTTMMGGALPWAERGAAGIFGGRLAQTADLQKLALAEKLQAEGASSGHILSRTGWFQGADKKWRFEIPDQHSRLTQKAFDVIDRESNLATMKQTPQTGVLSDYLHHPELYAAYPEAANVPVYIEPARAGAGGSFGAGMTRPGDISQADIVLNAAAKDPRSVVLHEGQHLIQHAEDFAPGANTFGLKPNTPAWGVYEGILKKLSSPTPEAEIAHLLSPEYTYADYVKEYRAAMKSPEKRAALDRMAQETAVREAYQRSAGEAEARAVQTRRDYTPEQRQIIPPEATYDIPLDRQIVDTRRMLNPQEARAEAPRDERMWSPLSKLKLQKPIDELEHSYRGKPVAAPPVIDPASLVGQYGYFTPSDLSATGRTVTSIDRIKLDRPIRQHGGIGFQQETGLGWASEPSVARKMDRQIAEIAEKTGKPVNIIPFTMAPQAIDASHHVAEPLSQLLAQAPITRANAAAFDEYMKAIRPDWVGIKKPGFVDYVANMEKGMKAKREMAQEMEKARWSSKGFPNVAAVRHAMSDLSLIDLPRNTTGMSIARYEPGQGLIDTSHPSYSRGVAASKQVPVGRLAEPVPFNVFAPDIAAGLDAANARNLAMGKKVKIEPRYHMEKPTEGVPIVQEFTPQWLDRFMAHVNRVKG